MMKRKLNAQGLNCLNILHYLTYFFKNGEMQTATVLSKTTLPIYERTVLTSEVQSKPS